MRSYKNISSLIKFLIISGETILINICFFIAFYIQQDHLSSVYFVEEKNFLLFFNLTYFIGISLFKLILHKQIVSNEKILDQAIKQTLTHFILLSPVILLTNKLDEFEPLFCLILTISVFLSILIWRTLFRNLLRYFRTREKCLRSIIILGSGELANEVYRYIVQNKTNGYKLIGFFDNIEEDNLLTKNEKHLGNTDAVIPFLQENKVSDIFCALPIGADKKALKILSYAENNLVRFYFVPDFKKSLNKKVRLEFLSNMPIISLRSEPLESFFNAFIKRTFDLIFSISFLLTVFPFLFIIIAPLIKLSSKGPIFFTQRRTGKNGKEFTCLKFRSMQINKDADKIQATKKDNRTTKIGRFLRKTNLDETPQFINVLVGDMSIIGPRPHMLKHTEKYSKLIDKYMLRHLSKPGITGFAQVSGHRGETKNIQEMEKRIAKDVWYLENWTIGLDLWIVWRTIILMLKGDKTAY